MGEHGGRAGDEQRRDVLESALPCGHQMNARDLPQHGSGVAGGDSASMLWGSGGPARGLAAEQNPADPPSPSPTLPRVTPS